MLGEIYTLNFQNLYNKTKIQFIICRFVKIERDTRDRKIPMSQCGCEAASG